MTTHKPLLPNAPLEMITTTTLSKTGKLQVLDRWERKIRRTPFGAKGMLQSLLGTLDEIRRARRLLGEAEFSEAD